MMKVVSAAAKSISIMPSEPLPLAGYSGRPDPSQSVASHLEASIVLFTGSTGPIVLVGLDTLFASKALEQCVRRNLHESSVELFLIATHTHFAPSLDDQKPLLGAIAPAYLEHVGKQIADTIAELVTAARPVSGHYGNGRAVGGIYRRRLQPTLRRRFPFVRLASAMAPNSRVETYDALQVAVLGDPSAPCAVVWTWPCHAVASPDQLAISADFPGEVRNAVRRFVGDANLPVIYLPGFCGDIRPDIRGSRWSFPNLLQNLFVPLTPFSSTTPDTYRSFCVGISEQVVETMANAAPIELQLPETRQTPFAIGQYMTPAQNASIEIRSLTIGEMSFMFFGAEVCSPYYQLIGHRPNQPQFLSGCTGPVFGYLPTDRQLITGGYEVSGFLKAFGWQGRFSRKFQRDFVHTATQISVRR